MAAVATQATKATKATKAPWRKEREERVARAKKNSAARYLKSAPGRHVKLAKKLRRRALRLSIQALYRERHRGR